VSANSACHLGRAWSGPDCGPGFTSPQPPRSRPAWVRTERSSPLGLRDRSCRAEAWLLERRLSRWRDNYNGRIRRRPRSVTSRRGTMSCLGITPVDRLCSAAARSGATLAPSHRRPFGYSWRGSIAKRSREIQARLRLTISCLTIFDSMQWVNQASSLL
jgi:hypothetical protein